ncbi:MAG: nucleotidyltransferase family protein [Acidobacteriota bacterium]
MAKKSKIGLIILAAGASVRMGKPKQSLEFNGKTLLQRAVQTAHESECRPIVVVLGAQADILKNEIKNFDVQIVENTNWKKGMSSSIKTALEKNLEINSQINGVLIMVCDQPFVSVELINQIVEMYRKTDSLIIASKYGETLGVPALFGRRVFPQLLKLENESGAKKIIRQFQNETAFVSFEEGNFDVDTPEDYLKLINGEN